MKNLDDILTESLLDDQQQLLDKVEKSVYFKKLRDIFDNRKHPMGIKDLMGRDVHVGDFVFVVHSLHPKVGLVTSIDTTWSMARLEFADGYNVEARHTLVIPTNKLKDFYEIIKQ